MSNLICGRPASDYPDHPQLRELAIALEEGGIAGEITDDSWRLVFISTEEGQVVGFEPAELLQFYGMSVIKRQIDYGDEWATTEERGWWRLNVPIMRAYLAPGDEHFDEVFDAGAAPAERVEPVERVPLAWQSAFEVEGRIERFVSRFLEIRLNDEKGNFLGVVHIVGRDVRAALQNMLTRGDSRLFERMQAVAEPDRRPAAILFADLEASGVLSRKLSSRAYFHLIRELTTLIDERVTEHGGIVGKHAGDGASALFIAEQLGTESAAASAAITAARGIKLGASSIGDPSEGHDLGIRVNVGLHWGSTLTVGQVATGGRLDVTALGDEMNEAARIEGAAQHGQVLASKSLIERLSLEAAAELKLDLEAISYNTLDELTDSEKALRDAATISVAEV